ncbi:hypothetical protein ACP70R_029004 [Stipagrostis hirtigluma subsp. patula]
MRTPAVPYVSLHDLPDDLADCDGSCRRLGADGGGLCCPDDPLDEVMRHAPPVDPGFLEALGLAASPPARVQGQGLLLPHDIGRGEGAAGESKNAHPAMGSGGGGQDADMSCGERGVCAAFLPEAGGVLVTDTGSGGPPPLLAHDAVSSGAFPASMSWGRQPSTAWPETGLPPAHASPSPLMNLVVPTKKRHGPVSRRRKGRHWSQDFLFDAVPVTVTARVDPSDNNGNGGDNVVGGGGIRRRIQARRQRKGPSTEGRVCSHCETSETPQWRAGPEGPGTLCNACGIRYGMHNKLLPEYRPSTSPSFRSDMHSNRHRKVVKLREQKEKEKIFEVKAADPTVLLLPPPNQSEFVND